MKDFAIDGNTNDIIIFNNDIEMVNGDELLRQEAEKLIGTNKGEWFLNKNQGIKFSVILGKNVTSEIVKEQILQALKMIDETFFIETVELKTEDRVLHVKFSAVNETGQQVRGENVWA